MIELRWKLDPEHPEEYKENAPLDAFTLQYRMKEMTEHGWEWSEWKDVLFVAEDK
jgi:hypothetical protein